MSMSQPAPPPSLPYDGEDQIATILRNITPADSWEMVAQLSCMAQEHPAALEFMLSNDPVFAIATHRMLGAVCKVSAMNAPMPPIAPLPVVTQPPPPYPSRGEPPRGQYTAPPSRPQTGPPPVSDEDIRKLPEESLAKVLALTPAQIGSMPVDGQTRVLYMQRRARELGLGPSM